MTAKIQVSSPVMIFDKKSLTFVEHLKISESIYFPFNNFPVKMHGTNFCKNAAHS